MATSPAADRPNPTPHPRPHPAPRPVADPAKTQKVVDKLNAAFPHDDEMQRFIEALKRLLGHA